MSSQIDLVIRDGLVYIASTFIKADIAVDDGKVVAVGSSAQLPKGSKEISALGKYVIPELIDTRGHFRILARRKKRGLIPLMSCEISGFQRP